jgi:hypothetical protein
MNDTTTSATTTSKGLGLGEFGLLLLLVGLIGGGLLGTKYETAGAYGDGEFNWTLFLLAAGPALIAACVCWAGNAIVTELRR